jgi:iron complex outermembrane receptor protein
MLDVVSRHMLLFRSISGSLMLAVLALSAGFARAQSDQLASTLEPVVVTVGRLEQERFDAPASVDSVDAQTILNSGARVNLSSALDGVPGVVSLNRNNYAQDLQISIRGFGARSTFGLRGIRLIIDDIPATTPDGQGQSSSVSLTSADRIEVLRGPLAQLYGNSSGGVIRSFTRAPTAEPEASAELYTGSYGLLRSDWQASGRLGNFGAVADLSTFRTDGWRDNSAARREQFNTVMSWTPSQDTRLRVIANVFNMPLAQDPLGLTAAQLAARPSQAGTNALLNRTRKEVSQEQVGLVFEQRLSSEIGWLLRSYVGTRDNLQYQASATPGSANASWVGLDRLYSGLGLQLNGRHRLSESIAVQWVAGVDLDRSAEGRQAGQSVLGEKVPGSVTRDEDNVAANRDAFAQANWFFGERWTLVTGLRSSQVGLSSTDRYLSDGNGSGEVTYRAISPVAGLTWHATPTLNLYANAGRGFETPTLSEVAYTRSGNAIVGVFNPTLEAARSRHEELGLKWRPATSLLVDAALFRVRTEDEIVASLSSAGRTAFANAAATQRQGAELALRYRIDSNWRLDSALTLMQAEYASAFTSGSTVVGAGKALPGVPQRQLYTALNWSEKPVRQTDRAPAQGLGARLEWVGRSGIWANDANTARAAGGGVVNLRAWYGWRWGNLPLQAFGAIDNLASRQYVGSVIVNQAQFQYYEPALPRNWMLGVRLNVPLGLI